MNPIRGFDIIANAAAALKLRVLSCPATGACVSLIVKEPSLPTELTRCHLPV